jgi:hypothetical protein
MAQITITGEARTLTGILLAAKTIILRPHPLQPWPDGGVFRLPEPITVVSDGAGLVSFTLTAGGYVGEVATALGLVRFPFQVADTPSTQTFSECLARVDAAVYDALALAQLAVGLRFYHTTAAAIGDADLASGAGFVAFNSGVLWVWRKQPVGGGVHTAQPLGPVFPQVPSPDGTAALPGIAFASDLDNGFYLAGANQTGWSAAGVLRVLLSSTALQVSVPITGTAVTQTATDITAGRLMKVGDFGLGGLVGNMDAAATGQRSRMARFSSNGPAGGYAWQGLSLSASVDGLGVQIAAREVGASSEKADLAVRSRTAAGAWTGWNVMYGRENLLGPVSQAAGVPTGAAIQRGSNANGEFVRFADGTQICTCSMAASAGAAVTWTFPAAFAAAPVVTGNAQATVLAAVCLDAAPTTTTASLSVRDKTDARRADTMHLTAVGRWF